MADTENKIDDEEQKPRRRLNMTLDSYTMFATPRTRKDKKQLRLTFGCSNGYPNVNVETDEDMEANKENGWLRVSSRLNGTNFGNMCRLIETAVTKEPGWKQAIECYHTWKGGRQFEEKQHVNDLIVGVDNQGLVFLSIIEAGRTTTKFTFGPTEWHSYKKEDGSQWGQKELNHLCALESATGLRTSMGALIAADCMDNATQRAGLPSPSMKPAGDGQGTGNYKRDFNGSAGGYQKKPWNGNNQNGGGQGGYQKKPWNGGGGQNANGGGGFQKKPWNGGGQQGGGQGGGGNYQRNFNNGGGNGQQGGFQKKQWDNNRDQGQPKKVEPNVEIDLDSFDDL